ncbi:anthranilate phosphoribosyltransferase [bacterium]|nr:anthranilate phosphoribosyltransferase [bacterium]MCI0603327.1 anthranilate phosphoribosyltransferase [bacterium]
MNFAELLNKVKNGIGLTREESKHAVFAMMEGEPQTGTLLTAFHEKGETAQEIIGFAEAMREKSVRVPLDGIKVLDTCGTGGDKKNTFNISTISAFVLAGCGIPIVKHGNRAASSACGSADLLEALSISYRMKPEQVPAALHASGFAFLFAPDYHPATKSVVAVRKRLGFPTIFNLLGPLTNPAFPAAQVIGVYNRNALPLVEEAIRKMDPEKRAYLVHSSEGYDEATLSCDFYLHSTFSKPTLENAKHFGFGECRGEDLCGGSPKENASIALSILSGESGAKRETVLLNAMLGYLAFYPEASVEDAKSAVAKSIDSGAALHVVQRTQELFPL